MGPMKHAEPIRDTLLSAVVIVTMALIGQAEGWCLGLLIIAVGLNARTVITKRVQYWGRGTSDSSRR